MALHSNRITSLTLINYNEIWVGRADAGVMVLKISDDFSVKASYQSNRTSLGQRIELKDGIGSNFINQIIEDNAHSVWIGTTGGGVTKCIPYPSKDRTEASLESGHL